MTQTAPTRALGRQDISDRHARGLCRDLFRRLKSRLAPQLRTLQARLGTVQWPQPSSRETMAVYLRTRQSLRSCSDYFSDYRIEGAEFGSYAILLLPGKLEHADGDEPVLVTRLVRMTMQAGRASVVGHRCGRISHHAVARMYQRLRTSDHEEVMAELRSALWWVVQLRNVAILSPRSSTIHQLPIPSDRGVLRCIRDVERGELEARTFTLCRPGDRVDLSVESMRRWGRLEGDTKEAGFGALLREPTNRWLREVYQPGRGA